MPTEVTDSAGADPGPSQHSAGGRFQLPELRWEGHEAPTRQLPPPPPGRGQEALEVLSCGEQGSDVRHGGVVEARHERIEVGVCLDFGSIDVELAPQTKPAS